MDAATLTPREAKLRLDRLVGKLCQLVEQLQAASAPFMPAGPMPPQQQSLLWTFALLVARCRRVDVGRACPVVDRRPQESTSRLQRCLRQLELVEERSADVAGVAGELRSLLTEWKVDTLFSRIDPYAGAPHALVHVFERLLAGSDANLRRTRGAYFTPYPLVKYVVRSVDLLLQRELGIAEGLSAEQPELRVVDPACGSGAFLLGVLAQMRAALDGQRDTAASPGAGQWLKANHLTGIDIMPASCGAVEILMEQELFASHTLRCAPGPGWSAHCTNPLHDRDLSHRLFAGRVPVILGNPPYNNFGQRNRDPWIIEQLGEYKRGLDEKKLNLDDDFIKFIRWAQYWVDQRGRGVVGLVTNNTYLSGLTHRQMRVSLCDTFDQIYVLNLHGSSKRRESAPDGTRDENVFPIQQGVAVGLFVKTGAKSGAHRVWHADLWGRRDAKLKTLADVDVTRTCWTPLDLSAPYHFYVPRRKSDAAAYGTWPALSEIFQHYVSGVQTKRDKLFVGFTREEVEQRVGAFLATAARGEFESDIPQWLRKKAVDVPFDRQSIRPYMVAPLDVRWTYYEPRLLGRARHQLLRNLDADNVALVFMRQATSPAPYDHFLVTHMLVSDRVFYSAHGAPFVAPLYLRDGTLLVANLKPPFLQQLGKRLGIPFLPADGAAEKHFSPRDVFHWIYAAVHDRGYRERYHELLSVDFPRVPWPDDPEEFVQLCQEGERLVAAHLRATACDVCPDDTTQLPFDQVELPAGYPRWQAERLLLNRKFVWPERVEAAVWQARIGGYAVLPRWLKQRRGRLLTPDDVTRLRLVIDGLRSGR